MYCMCTSGNQVSCTCMQQFLFFWQDRFRTARWTLWMFVGLVESCFTSAISYVTENLRSNVFRRAVIEMLQAWVYVHSWEQHGNVSCRVADPSQEFHGSIQFIYYLQFHLHMQLVDVRKYAESKGVALKGDLPIGKDQQINLARYAVTSDASSCCKMLQQHVNQ